MQRITLPFSRTFNALIYRLDKNDPLISGNKFYKLKPWVSQALETHKALISCGGAFSNHLHALAAVGLKNNIKTYGLVRGLEVNNPTMTMQDCMNMGMTLIPVTREHYKKRAINGFLDHYKTQIKHDSLWIAEGGMGELSIKACEDIAININDAFNQHQFDTVYLAVGSGGTLAGIARRLDFHIKLYAVPVLKHWHEVKDKVEHYLNTEQAQRITWLEGASYGGFGTAKAKHLEFMAHAEKAISIPLDPVYTSKLLRKVINHQLSMPSMNKQVLIIHTGGLQGRRSVEQKLKAIKLDPDYFTKFESQYALCQ